MTEQTTEQLNKSQSYQLALNNPHADKLPDNAVVCLMAPTASGKTSLAYELYDTGRFELISVDSALIYRDMNIGTAKPTPQELVRYPHHMIDLIDPHETFSVAQFVEQTERLIEDIHGRGKLPLLVGGTMMYYNAMFSGLSPVPQTDSEVRAEVDAWLVEAGLKTLYEYLGEIDPQLWATLKPNDTQRITRAIEVYRQTGKKLSEWQALPKVAIADHPNQQWLGLAVMPERRWLHERIAKRLHIMWEQGFLQEVEHILQTYPVTTDDPAMRCVGYRQVLEYFTLAQQTNLSDLEKSNAFQDMQDKALYATRQLAKRQYTWLRGLLNSFGHYPDSHDAVRNHHSTKTLVLTNEWQQPSKLMLKFNDMTSAKQFVLSYL